MPDPILNTPWYYGGAGCGGVVWACVARDDDGWVKGCMECEMGRPRLEGKSGETWGEVV